MQEWYRQIQLLIDEIDDCIRNKNDEALTLSFLAKKLGYSEFYVSRKFKEISGMSLRDYMGQRALAFALKEVRDTTRGLLEIAYDYGFSSHEAFSRAFKESYGVSPSVYRRKPVPVALRTVIKPFDCYLLALGGTGMENVSGDVKVYFVTIPAHKFLHIRNYESIGYWDFWQKQSKIPGQDCETICGLLESIPNKLDDNGGREAERQIVGTVSSWRLSTNRREGSAVGEFRWQKPTASDCLMIIREKFRPKCSLWMWKKEPISCSSTDRLILKRRIRP